MRWGTGLSLQHGPYTKVHWIEIRWWGRPQFLAPKLGKIVLIPFLSLLGCVCEGVPSCWKVNSQFLKCFFISPRAGVKILLMYTFVFTFTLSFTKIRGNFHVLDTAAHTMMDAGFWQQLTVKMSSEMLAECFTSTLSFWWLNCTSTVNSFSSEKIISPSHVPDFIKLKLRSVNPFLFLKDSEMLGLSQFQGRKLEIGFDNGPHWFWVHFHLICHFPHGPFWISSDPLMHSFDVFFDVCWSGAPTSWMIFGIAKFLVPGYSIINCWYWHL